MNNDAQLQADIAACARRDYEVMNKFRDKAMQLERERDEWKAQAEGETIVAGSYRDERFEATDDALAAHAEILESMRQVGQRVAHCFRPLRNEEDRAVEEMVDVVKGPAGEGESVRETVCRRLYRAGYRKPGGDA